METDFSSSAAGTGSTPTGSTGSAGQKAFDDSTTAGRQSRTSLREELANLKSDLDTLMSHAATLTDRELSDARDRLMTKFGSMRESAKGMASKAGDQLSQGMDVTTEYVKEKPIQSVAIAAGIGLLLGALLRGSSDR